MSPRAIARRRLRTQGIGDPRFGSPEAVVGWLGAVQAQEYAVAKWSLGLRSAGVNEAAVDLALEEGRVLRTHLLRPTWHFVLPRDIRWMLTATAPRVRTMMRSYDRKLELDEPLYARTNEIIGRAVEGGRHRTRRELAEELGRKGIDASGQRLGHIVLRAELDAVVCSGVTRGKQMTYALLAERAPGALELDPDEALAELTRRYFTSHGPATARDFRWWSSLTAGEAKRGLEMVADELESMVVGDLTFWQAGEPPPAREMPAAHLLQGYDEYIVGYTESRHVLDVEQIARAVPGTIPFYHAVIVDCQAAGHWRRQLRKGEMVIEMKLLRALEEEENREVERAVERYAEFVGMPATIRA
jgi:Winged helix DNA-binding domain